jgi:CBS domain-containing protein
MPVGELKNLLQGLTVKQAMRRQVIRLPGAATLEQAIRYLLKFKVNAILITGEGEKALGVVTKTDLMGAYYAGLPITLPCEAVMVGPPLFCPLHESLDAALDTMRLHCIHRLYVWDDEPSRVVGVLAYPDIVGLLYGYCHVCDRSLIKPRKGSGRVSADHFRVREVMTLGVSALEETDPLSRVMEVLAAQRFGALLIRGQDGLPAGVISKTDLILAYRHGMPLEAPAGTVMQRPVQACDQKVPLAQALRQMIFADIHRLFVYKETPANLVGVLSLSDVARFRSGTCRACISSRIKVK